MYLAPTQWWSYNWQYVWARCPRNGTATSIS
jgi:hypothetical protein